MDCQKGAVVTFAIKNMTLVFASANPNKVAEIRQLLPEHITLLGLDEIGCAEDIPETASTIEGNAILKANYVSEKYGYDCFADDTGLEVEALEGAPGVLSARYAGDAKDPSANIDKLLLELENHDNRRARFVTVIALNIGDSQHLFTGICPGTIISERRGQHGFGYDPVFVPEGHELTFAEMPMAEKATLSHRAQAVNQLAEFLRHEE